MRTCTNKDCTTPVEKQRFYFHKVNKRPMGKCMNCVRRIATEYYHRNKAAILERSQTIRDLRKEMRTL